MELVAGKNVKDIQIADGIELLTLVDMDQGDTAVDTIGKWILNNLYLKTVDAANVCKGEVGRGRSGCTIVFY